MVSQGLQIGTRVVQAHKGERGVICEDRGHDYLVIFPDGSEAGSQRLGALSPYTRITLVEDSDLASPSEVAALFTKRTEKRAADRVAQDAEVTQHGIDTRRIETELREKYPWAKPNKPSANLKKELSLVFPGVKFSVRYESYAGGDSVNYSWTLGPTGAEVAAIADKYQDGNFNGMEDIHEYDRSAHGAAVDRVLGRAKYVQGSRHIPHELHEQIGRLLCTAQHVDYAECEKGAVHLYGQGDPRWLSDHVYQLLARTTFPANPQIQGLKWSDKSNGYELVFNVVHSAVPLGAHKDEDCSLCAQHRTETK